MSLANILSAIQDLLKYYLVSQVNTGDKTMDNLINTFLITILTLLFGEALRKKAYEMWKYIKISSINNSTNITKSNFKYYETLINSNDVQLNYCTWKLREKSNNEFTSKLILYFSETFSWKFGSYTAKYYDMSNFTSEHRTNSIDFDIISDHVSTTILPIFIRSSGMIGLIRDSGSIYILYENDTILKEFHAYIMRMETKILFNDDSDKKSIKIINYFNDTEYLVYPDRTFDSFVSRHKQTIINALDDFQKAANGKSLFNGFGTYNIGFMLYGEPGTGKTSVIKAVCNYLGRNGLVIDMRKVKTVKALENIFYGEYTLDKYVYILEEFDCVQGVIDRSRDESKEDTVKILSEKEKLQKQHMELLKIRNGSKDSMEEIDKEIKSIKKKIENTDDRITIDSLLTVLDGVIETRGRCIIATTNYIDRIDSALIREGRFDYKINLGKFNEEEIKEMLRTMFKGYATEKELKYLEQRKLRGNEFTPVRIINLCHRYRSLKKVVEHVAVVDSD